MNPQAETASLLKQAKAAHNTAISALDDTSRRLQAKRMAGLAQRFRIVQNHNKQGIFHVVSTTYCGVASFQNWG